MLLLLLPAVAAAAACRSSPLASLPCPCKASTAVKFCPLLFKLQQAAHSSSNGSEAAAAAAPSSAEGSAVAAGTEVAAAAVNAMGLPYRMVLAVATLDSVLLYDMQVRQGDSEVS
jgi:hypothetical protein